MSEYSDNNVFQTDEDAYNKAIKSSAPPERKKDIDLDKTLYSNIIDAASNSTFDFNAFNSLSQAANTRNDIYNLIDTMCDDGTISAVVETYAEDTTERNDNGDIVWVESANEDVAKCVQFYLDSMNVNKNIYKWVYNLCKYGDIYLRLYRNSEFEDDLFDNKKKPLNEDLKIVDYKSNDKYAHYVEMVTNPAEMFELTKMGKTVGYVKAPVTSGTVKKDDLTSYFNFTYNYKKSDVYLYPATEYVHAALEDSYTRDEETVNIFLNDNDYDAETNARTYKVRRGNSLLSNVFRIWRELSLLQASVLLNRVTKSSIVRLINIEVGDMPKENVTKVIMDVKRLIEQKAAIKKNDGMAEYTSPGPIENNVYLPTHEGKGAVTTSQIGGDVDVKSLADLEYYQNMLYGALRVPKQYFNITDDSTGFNGGSSLSIISSRYAKMIKRLQNTILQALTDAINLFLIDDELDSYVNNFKLHMLIPTTQEEIDRRDNMSSKVQLTSDIMNMLGDIDDTATKLKILKSLLSGIINDNDILAFIQEEIDKIEQEDIPETDEGSDSTSDDTSSDVFSTEAEKQPESKTETDILPSPEELGVDLDNTENI